VLFIQKWVIILSNGYAYSVSGQAHLALIQNSLAHKPTHFFCHPLPNDAKDRWFKRNVWPVILRLGEWTLLLDFTIKDGRKFGR